MSLMFLSDVDVLGISLCCLFLRLVVCDVDPDRLGASDAHQK